MGRHQTKPAGLLFKMPFGRLGLFHVAVVTGPGNQQLFRAGLSYYFFFFPFFVFFFAVSFLPFFAFFSFFFAIVSSSFFNVFLTRPTLLWLLIHPGGTNYGYCLRSAYILQTIDTARAHVSRIMAAF
jgi:hypothetical protein